MKRNESESIKTRLAKYEEQKKIRFRPSRLGLYNSPILQMGKIYPPNNCSGYDVKQSDGEATVLELWKCSVVDKRVNDWIKN